MLGTQQSPEAQDSVSQFHARHLKTHSHAAEWLSLDQNVAILLNYLI